MEGLVRHTHCNSAQQADSYVHMAMERESLNWAKAMWYYSLVHWMTDLAHKVVAVQMTELAVVRTWVIENSRMAVLQMLSKHHSLDGHIQIEKD